MEIYTETHGGSGNESDKLLTQYPTLQCYNKNDRFTKDDVTVGNGVLTYKVGLLTEDELVLAGSVQFATAINSYLTRDYFFWTMISNGIKDILVLIVRLLLLL